MSENSKIKRIPKNDVPIKPRNVLYDAFCLQMSAALELARAIDADKLTPAPSYVKKFLAEFGYKVA